MDTIPKQKPYSYIVQYQGVQYSRLTYRVYTHGIVYMKGNGVGKLKCSSSLQGAYKMQSQYRNWYGVENVSPILELVEVKDTE